MGLLVNKLGEDYAVALKEALALKRSDQIERAVDDELGYLLYSVSQWSIASAVQSGKLWRTFSQDPDFQGDVLCAIVSYSNKVDLDRAPKEILTYLHRVGLSAIRDLIMKVNAQKRQHEDVPLEGAVMTTDFYGRRLGAAYEIEKDTRRC